MPRPGNPRDNAVAESLFKTSKRELIKESMRPTSLGGLPWARSLRASSLVSRGYFACFSWAQAPGTRGLAHPVSPHSQALSHFLSVSLFGPPQGLQAPPQVSPSAHILCRWKAFSSVEYDTESPPSAAPAGGAADAGGMPPASNFLPHPRSG